MAKAAPDPTVSQPTLAVKPDRVALVDRGALLTADQHHGDDGEHGPADRHRAELFAGEQAESERQAGDEQRGQRETTFIGPAARRCRTR